MESTTTSDDVATASTVDTNGPVLSSMTIVFSSKAYVSGRYTVYFTEAALIIIANILTLMVVKRSKKLRDIPANTFVVSLACADGMIGVLLPATMMTSMTSNQAVWITSACVFRGPYYAMFCISLVTLLAIGVDRCVAVVHPLLYRRRMTTKIARIASILIWIGQLLIWETFTCYYGSQISAGKNRPRAAHDMFPRKTFFFMIQMEILLPIVGNVILYAFIYIRLRRRKVVVSVSARQDAIETRTKNQLQAKTKAFTKMMALVLGYLVIAWLPYYILVPIHKVNEPTTPIWYVYAFDAAAVLFYSNSFMNPLIYSWQNRDFREAYTKILSCSRLHRSRSTDVNPSECTVSSVPVCLADGTRNGLSCG
ncbi:hypothetical protein LSH36_193g11027 [Paralvinella palmiformis]|uniref:G-protein coupled receptors family 1 profile domain-containing protein n=1 Tax=Paralvinella palmiformis TaxID=53620 RepID=A0AAD9N720_9ANNE|nr:hypothetical protein LSH36_193g11027 [Paralvinella palmiformis]